MIAQLAAAKAGVTLAVIDPKVSTAEEIEYILQDSKASGLLFEPKIAGRNQTEIVQGLFPELATCTSIALLTMRSYCVVYVRVLTLCVSVCAICDLMLL